MDWLIGIILWLLIGALIGWLGGIVMGTGGSWLRNIICGILGGVVGGFIHGITPIPGGPEIPVIGGLFSLLFAIGGACIVIFIASKLKI